MKSGRRKNQSEERLFEAGEKGKKSADDRTIVERRRTSSFGGKKNHEREASRDPPEGDENDS